jgi:hypothetical protein
LAKPPLLVAGIAHRERAAQKAGAGHLRDRRQRRDDRQAARLRHGVDLGPTPADQIRLQLAKDREAHAIDQDQQQRMRRRERRGNPLQDMLHRNDGVVVRAGLTPVAEQLTEASVLVLPGRRRGFPEV